MSNMNAKSLLTPVRANGVSVLIRYRLYKKQRSESLRNQIVYYKSFLGAYFRLKTDYVCCTFSLKFNKIILQIMVLTFN